jgi:hypothetical protein
MDTATGLVLAPGDFECLREEAEGTGIRCLQNMQIPELEASHPLKVDWIGL